MNIIYLDNAATTPTDPLVLEAMLPFFSNHFGNASSKTHPYGWFAEEAVETARKQVADLLVVNPKEVVFTSGATESINLAMKGVVEASNKKKKHIIATTIEHTAVLETCRYLERQGVEVTYLEPDTKGNITAKQVENALREDTISVSFMAVNNEIGNIYPVEEIAEITKNKEVIFHTDATQAVGKIGIDTKNIDLLSFSGHKLYAPKGIGVLIARKGVKIVAQQHGGKQHERGLRAGTLPVPLIVGLGKACELADKNRVGEEERVRQLRNRLEEGILGINPDFYLNGSENRLSNVSNICFKGFESERLMSKLNQIAVSNGSACNAANTFPSHVLKAIGLSDADAFSSLRFSLGRFTTESEIEQVLCHVRTILENYC